jgi:hypothetical protein
VRGAYKILQPNLFASLAAHTLSKLHVEQRDGAYQFNASAFVPANLSVGLKRPPTMVVEVGRKGSAPYTLDSMAELLSGIADELDNFLDSGLFYHVQEAIQRVRDMIDLRDLLEQQSGESLA